jgi:type II secretory pathway pseudopilin PulG
MKTNDSPYKLFVSKKLLGQANKIKTGRSTFCVPRSTKVGFTLVELIVAVGIFALLMVLSVGALLAIVAANKNAQGIKSAVDNLNFSLETMARSIRTGSNYDCNPSTSLPDDCDIDHPSGALSFTDQKGLIITYRWDISGGVGHRKIIRDYNGSINDMTAPEVDIDRLNFYVNGAAAGDSVQPNVLILVGGKVNYKGSRSTRFDVETFAVQRFFNK